MANDMSNGPTIRTGPPFRTLDELKGEYANGGNFPDGWCDFYQDADGLYHMCAPDTQGVWRELYTAADYCWIDYAYWIDISDWTPFLCLDMLTNSQPFQFDELNQRDGLPNPENKISRKLRDAVRSGRLKHYRDGDLYRVRPVPFVAWARANGFAIPPGLDAAYRHAARVNRDPEANEKLRKEQEAFERQTNLRLSYRGYARFLIELEQLRRRTEQVDTVVIVERMSDSKPECYTPGPAEYVLPTETRWHCELLDADIFAPYRVANEVARIPIADFQQLLIQALRDITNAIRLDSNPFSRPLPWESCGKAIPDTEAGFERITERLRDLDSPWVQSDYTWEFATDLSHATKKRNILDQETVSTILDAAELSRPFPEARSQKSIQDEERGRKIVESARKGHEAIHGTKADREARQQAYRKTYEETKKKNPILKHCPLCKKVAEKHGVSVMTIYRALRMGTPNN